MKEGDKSNKVLKKRDRRDDQDKVLLARSNQGKKTKKRKLKSVEEQVFEIALDDVEQTFDDKVGDASQQPHTDANETQTNVALRILKKDWFKESSKPELHYLDWNIIKTVDDAPE
nr:hypothetical protein [Tanacetum cinerariifolium]